jgi:26S proteasome regulatory subunit N13
MAEGTRHYMAFKAGRAYRRGDTNFVDPSPTKGAIYLSQEDELVHFRWKNRDTDSFEEVRRRVSGLERPS